jgi:hypothetical protein
VGNVCEAGVGLAFTANFDVAAGVYPITDGGVSVDHCFPPWHIAGRGGYFDGANISAQVTDFTPYPTATINTWVQLDQPSAAIFTMFPRFWKAMKPYCDDECDWEDCLARY